MSRYDMVVFGATGYTGKWAVVELAKQAKKYGLCWAISGRSESKLKNLLQETSVITREDHTKTKIIQADVDDEISLRNMCRQAKVLINCCGPYWLYGEPVVKAAIESQTDYVDVSGEPYFMDTMQLKYNEAAQKAGVYIIHACGFDSIPNDMGVIYLEQQFEGTLNSVESYVTVDVPEKYKEDVEKCGLVNRGTYESFVYGLTKFFEMSSLRKKLFPQPLPSLKPKLKMRFITWSSGKWTIPFIGFDEPVIYRTQRYLHEKKKKRPVQFQNYFEIGSFKSILKLIFCVIFLFIMSMTKITRKLILDNPTLCTFGFVSRNGPSDTVTKNTYFRFNLFGVGWARGDILTTKPTKKICARVSGMNPGYGATVVALVFSAFTILTEKDKMPENGGVLTTGSAFQNTNLIENLNANGLKFEVIEKAKSE